MVLFLRGLFDLHKTLSVKTWGENLKMASQTEDRIRTIDCRWMKINFNFIKTKKTFKWFSNYSENEK